MTEAQRSTRRGFLQGGGAVGLLALVPPARLARLLRSAPRASQVGRFLSAHELDTLRAVTARFVPGPPEDPDPGALEARVAEAIDLLLGAFTVHPPLIHAGGPFSPRGGAAHDDFADFVPLDAHAELGWRIRLEGSLGRSDREFAGPVKGLQTIYREGLAHLDERSEATYGVAFAQVPSLAQDALLSDQSDDQIQEFVGAAFANTLEAMYGPPEYGGNQGLVGWRYSEWPGDSQPRGYTHSQVSDPGPSGQPGPASSSDLRRLAPALAGRAAPRAAWWLGRRGFPR